MQKSAFDPIRIPPHIWDQEETLTALRNRDIASIFQLFVKYGGASQVRLSAATGIAQGRISQIMRRERQVTDLDVFDRIATGLGFPDHARMAMGLAPRQPTAPASDLDAEHEQQAQELAARLQAAAAIDPTMVMILSTDTNNLRLLDRRLGTAAIADKMRAHLKQIERAHHHAIRPGIRAQLAHVYAETASLAGWQAIDRMDLSTAWDHYEQAKAAARESGQPAVLAYVSAEQAYVLTKGGASRRHPPARPSRAGMRPGGRSRAGAARTVMGETNSALTGIADHPTCIMRTARANEDASGGDSAPG